MLSLILSVSTLDCLRQVYEDTNGDSWKDNSNWDTADYCTFYGVACQNSQIVSLVLSSNNLVGEMPSCISELPITTLDLSSNSLKGKFPDFSSTLRSINLQYNGLSEIPSNWCNSADFHGAMFRVAGNPLVAKKIHYCYLEADQVNVSGTALSFVSGEIQVRNASEFMVAGVDLSNCQVNFENPAELSKLDLSQSKLTSEHSLNMSLLTRMSFFQIGGAYLTLEGEFPTLTGKIDISDNVLVNNAFKLSELETRFTDFVARNCSLVGMAPSQDELESFELSRNVLLDISENQFFCRPDSKDATDCRLVIITRVSVAAGEIKVWFEGQKGRNAKIGKLEDLFTLAVVDFNNTVAEVQKLFYYNECETVDSSDGYLMTCKNNEGEEFPSRITDPEQSFVIMYDKNEISTESLKVYDDIKELLVDPVHETFIDYSHPLGNYKNEFSADYDMYLTAMGTCPDYKNFVLVTLAPFVKKYPNLFARVNYRYISMATPAEYYAEGAYSMHGERETYYDAVMVCANHLSDQYTFAKFTECYEQKSYNISCADEIYDEGIARDIQSCANDEYMKYIQESWELNSKELHSSWCPSMYFKHKYSYEYTYVCSDCLMGAEALKKKLCELMQEDHYPECYE